MNHFEETLSTRLISITAGKLLETIFNFAACGGNLFSDVDPSQLLTISLSLIGAFTFIQFRSAF